MITKYIKQIELLTLDATLSMLFNFHTNKLGSSFEKKQEDFSLNYYTKS